MWNCFPDWEGSALGLSWWTLQFPDQQQEGHFLQQRREALAKTLQHAFSVGFICGGTVVGLMLATWWDLENGPYQDATPPVVFAMRVQTYMCCACGLLSLFMILLASLTCLKPCVGFVGLEVCGLLVMLAIMLLIVLGVQQYLLRMMGHQPGAVFPGTTFSDVIPILAILGTNDIVTHVFPTRWWTAVPFKIAGVLTYIALLILGSEEEAPIFNLIILMGILWLSSASKRKLEIKERKDYCNLVSERQKRLTAEFQLSRMEQGGGNPKASMIGKAQNNVSVSNPDTESIFGRFFDIRDDDDEDLDQMLDKVAKVGKREHWLIQRSEVDLLPQQVLGHGGFGVVVTGVFRGCTVAVKLAAQALNTDAVRMHLPSFCNELRILRKVRHPNIVGYYGCVFEQARLGLICELVSGQTLDKYVQQFKAAESMQNRFIALHGVCSALQYLHTRHPPIVHSDVKANNVMVERRGDQVQSKLLDFGLGQILSRKPRHLGGTLAWMAPDVYRHQGRKPECSGDVYSFGHLIVFVLTGKKPLASHTEAQVKHMLMVGMLPNVLWPGVSPLESLCKPLVDDCLQLEPSLRPPMPKVYEVLVRVARESDMLAGLRMEWATPDQLQPWTDSVVHECLTASSHNRARRVKGQNLVPRAAEGERTAGLITKTTRYALVGRIPTTDEGMIASLFTTMMQWNFALTESPCCLYHGAVTECIRICEQLREYPCQQTFMPTGHLQCLTCGLLFDQGEGCAACGTPG